ncbi:MAG: hypothetical protein CM15mP32_1370 [Flavobacteriaceae bacterium]|nr:MAG: hypothetical protein CM15mP32_1370 [Flavobacteriaceae bacterium]
MEYNFSYESFEGNVLKSKISARNIRWIEEDTLYRLTDYFKRSFDLSGAETIESSPVWIQLCLSLLKIYLL